MSRLTLARRLAATAVVPVLALGALPSPAQAGQAEADQATDYLAGNLEDGLLTYESFGAPFTDFGGSIDALIALDAVGGSSAAVESIGNAISSRLSEYTDYAYTDDDYSTTPPTTGPLIEGRAAGGTAKAVVALQLAGLDPRVQPGSTDLVSRLEGLTGPDGRIADQVTRDGAAYPEGDFANNFGQAFAVTALQRAGSSRAADATTFLARQQCADDGYFTEGFVTANQGCADPSKADTDATALATSAFVPLYESSPDAAFVLMKVQQYFQTVQRSDGGFLDKPGGVVNANSTGLAVAALRQLATINLTFDRYATPLAVKGAAWLRAHQLDNVGTCAPYDSFELGAVAYDDAARTAGITGATEGQFLKATAQSAEGLLSAPSDPTVLRATGPTTYVADGSTSTVRVTGAAPGSAVCLSTGRVQKYSSVTGSVAFSVKAPARTAATAFTFTGVDGAPAKVTVKSLAAKTLGLRLRSAVTRGGAQRVIVSGLASGEKVTVRSSGGIVKTGTATSAGVFDTSFRVSTVPGTKTVSVTGQFSDRRASKTYSVVR